jgi:aldehyde dehydrogenase family 7 protein A1
MLVHTSTKRSSYHQSAAIIMPDADLSLAVPAVFFGSVGTAGQRCTSTRRLYLHRAIAPEFLTRLQALYASPALQPGDPLDARTLLGPLHSQAALSIYDDTIVELKDAGAEFFGSNNNSDRGRYENLTSPLDRGNFVRPTIAMIPKQLKSKSKFKSRAVVKSDAGKENATALWAKERFVPVLCVAEFEELDEAIAWNNAVPQGLSSSLWTRDLRHVGKWIGPAGSDAGIVNVSVFLCVFFGLVENESFFFRRSTSVRAVQRLVQHLVGTRSGSFLLPIFSGILMRRLPQSTGWGRESGGDAWKQYVRWSACTINFSDEAPLAQGVNFTPS